MLRGQAMLRPAADTSPSEALARRQLLLPLHCLCQRCSCCPEAELGVASLLRPGPKLVATDHLGALSVGL